MVVLLEACNVTNNGRHVGHHLGFYQELDIRLKPREIVIERTATASGADVLSSGKKTQKNRRGRGGIQPSLGARFLFHSIWWRFPLFEF